MSETNYKKVFVEEIELGNDTGKWWVRVVFSNGTIWFPKITECGKILSGIGKAEDKKYPEGQGYKYLKQFIDRCWGKTRVEIETLYKEFDPNGISGKPKNMECAILREMLDLGMYNEK